MNLLPPKLLFFLYIFPIYAVFYSSINKTKYATRSKVWSIL